MRLEPGPECKGPRILFLPVSSTTGIGEYVRSRALAREIKRRWPSARPLFALSREAPYARETDVESVLIDGSPTRNTEAVLEILKTEEPRLVVFDNAGRVAQLRCARELGAKTVFISSRPRKRRKGQSWRWMSRLDQHWVVSPSLGVTRPRLWERAKMRLASGCEVLFFDTLFAESDSERRRALRERLGVGDRPFLLVAGGGGGWSVGGVSSPEIFVGAAREIQEATGLAVVAVMGPLYGGELADGGGLTLLRQLDAEEMIDLIHDARLLAVGGGSIVYQALALGRACVASAVGGSDQRKRVDELARAGLIEAAPLDVQSISRAVIRLLEDGDETRAIEERIRAAGITNGMPEAMRALERLLGSPSAAR